MKTQDAIEFFGSHKAIADALGIWPQAVYRWGENVPPLRAYQLKEIMEAKREELWRQLRNGELTIEGIEPETPIDETEFERRCAASEEENRMMDY